MTDKQTNATENIISFAKEVTGMGNTTVFLFHISVIK